MSQKITIEIELSDEFLGNVMVTAFDGQYGACWYWAEPQTGSWLGIDAKDDAWVSASIRDQEEHDDSWTVTYASLADGIRNILDGRVHINDEIRASIHRGAVDNDAGEIDAIGADCIVQAGIMGSLVYG